VDEQTREARIKELLKRHGDPLRLHDWNFDDCPEEQRRACFYYEYLREAQREGRIDLADWEAAINYDIYTDEYDPEKAELWFAAQEKLGRAIQRPIYTRDWAQGLIRAPWPTEPWLDLAKDERKRRTERSGRFARTYFRRDLAHIAAAVPVPLKRWQVCGLVIFDKGVTVDELSERFATEVKALAKAQPELFEERAKGRVGWLLGLQKLSARRLRGLKRHFKSPGERFTDEDVIAYSKLTLRKLKKDPAHHRWYRRRRELSSAAQEAGTILDSLVATKVRQ
jgi:hypothetical protein